MILYVQMTPEYYVRNTDEDPERAQLSKHSREKRTRVYENVAELNLDEGFMIITFEDGARIGVNLVKVEEWSMPSPVQYGG